MILASQYISCKDLFGNPFLARLVQVIHLLQDAYKNLANLIFGRILQEMKFSSTRAYMQAHRKDATMLFYTLK